MARRSLRSIAGLLANPSHRSARRRKASVSRRKAKSKARTSSGRFKRNPAKRRSSKRKAAPRVHKNRSPRRRASVTRRRRAAARRGGFRRNPAGALTRPISRLFGKVPVVGKPLGQAAMVIPQIAVGGYLAPMGAFKANEWLAGQEWAAKLFEWRPEVRWSIMALIAAGFGAAVGKALKLPPHTVAAALGAGVFGAFYGAAQATVEPATGAIAIGKTAYGALNVPGYGRMLGTAPAYDVGPSLGAVVLGANNF